MGRRVSRGLGGSAARTEKAAERTGVFSLSMLPTESDRQLLTWTQSGDRLFVTAEKKASEKNWLDGSRKIETVEATFDLNLVGRSVYLNRMDALVSKKGYGREVLSSSLSAFKTVGFKTARAYVQFKDVDSQSMMAKLGGKIESETGSGRYWVFDLK